MTTREVHIIDKTPKDSFWQKIVILVLLPLSIAAGGWVFQLITTQKTLEKDYVAMSVSILNSDDKVDEDLREWAITIVNKFAPVPLPEGAKDSLREGVPLFGKAASRVTDRGVLIVKDGNGGNSIISMDYQSGCRATYSWKHYSADGKESRGEGAVFENYVASESSKHLIDQGQLMIKAGPVELEWSCGSDDFGWIYPSHYEMRYILDAKLEDFSL